MCKHSVNYVFVMVLWQAFKDALTANLAIVECVYLNVKKQIPISICFLIFNEEYLIKLEV